MTLLDAAAEPASADPWSAVVGQPQAVAALTAAVASPVHAYLLVGPRGSGKRTAAAAFAGELIAAADQRTGSDPARSARHRRLAARQEHPDVFVLSPAGQSLRREEEVSQLIVEASRTPVEGSRKVLVVDRFHTADCRPRPQPCSNRSRSRPARWCGCCWPSRCCPSTSPSRRAARESTSVRFPTPRSPGCWCRRVWSRPTGPRWWRPRLRGNLHRARVLATDERVAARHEAWWSVPDRLDGTGAAVALLVAELRAMIDEAGGALTERHRAEIVALEQREEHFGVRGSGRSVIEAQHKREHRQFRTDEIRFGLATLGARYRDQITSSPGDDPAAIRRAAAAMRAIDRLRATAESLIRSPNEALALQALLLDLPPVRPEHVHRPRQL